MLKLHGIKESNYYSTAKMALLEKGVDFEEVKVKAFDSPEFLEMSPMGKVPFLETPNGILTETSVIIEYVDQAFDGPPLYPTDPWKRAKARELYEEVALYLDLPARTCLNEAFFGGKVSDEVKATAKKDLAKGIAAVNKLAQFSPYIAGSEFTAADALTYFAIPLVAGVGKLLDVDPLKAIPGVSDLMAKVADRPSAKAFA